MEKDTLKAAQELHDLVYGVGLEHEPTKEGLQELKDYLDTDPKVFGPDEFWLQRSDNISKADDVTRNRIITLLSYMESVLETPQN